MARALLIGLASTVVVTVPATSPAEDVAHAQGSAGLEVVHILMDVSRSMGDTDGRGRVKINGAKQAITALLDGLYGSDVPVGLRSYPSRGGNCGSGELRVDFSRDYGVVGRAARDLRADGDTPTAEALRAAADDLRNRGYGAGEIVLVSDGESTCGDPCETAQAIAAEGFDVRVNTVGFDIAPEGQDELECIADATGGRYADAEDTEQLIREVGSLAMAELTLELDAPALVRTSVGRGTSQTIAIEAIVGNTAGVRADGVQVRIRATSERQPYIARANRALGNIEPNGVAPLSGGGHVEWTFTPPLDFEDLDLGFVVSATAKNAAPVEEAVSIRLRGEIEIGDAGPLLQDRDHVVIVGDSYSAGEGAGSYHDGTDTNGNRCHRSDLTYGADLFDNRTILACSGATTENFWDAQHPGSESPQLAQLADLDTPADLVVLTIGGNDVGFSTIIKTCVALPGDCHVGVGVSETVCGSGVPGSVDVTDEVRADGEAIGALLEGDDRAVDETGRMIPLGSVHDPCYIGRGAWGAAKIAATGDLVPDLVEVYSAVDAIVNSRASRDARAGEIAPILVLAYPSPVPDPGRYGEVLRICRSWLSYAEWRWAAGEFLPALNDAIREAVARAEEEGIPVRFVGDVQDAFGPSHTICDGDPYVNPIDTSTTLGAVREKLESIAVRFAWATSAESYGFAEPRLDEAAARRAQEMFHPNAKGYKAITAALVDWSLTDDARRPVERNVRGGDASWPPREPTLALRFAALAAGADTTQGSITEIQIEGLLPGAPLTATMQSRRTVVANTIVGDDGVARFVLDLSSVAEGEHLLSYATVAADGEQISALTVLSVDQPVPMWSRIGPSVAVVALALGSLLALIAFVGSRRRRAEPGAA